jgi:8-oxo-dGTP pyrophosphatase MutT (NUDIX family)
MAQEAGGGAAPAIGGAKRRRRRRRPKAKTALSASTGTATGAAEPKGRSAETRSGRARRQRRSSRSATKTVSTASARGTTSSKRRAASSKRARRRKQAPRDTSNGPTKREISAGGVVYRRDGDGVEVVLASRRTRRGDLAWGLAKGGIEDGESMEVAALREVREETGIRAEIEASLGETRYFYVWEDVRIRKTVHFFLMRAVGGDIDDRDDEMEEVRWVPLERALKRAAYRGERDVLQRAAELLR